MEKTKANIDAAQREIKNWSDSREEEQLGEPGLGRLAHKLKSFREPALPQAATGERKQQ